MSVKDDLTTALSDVNEVRAIAVDKDADFHGEPAVLVTVVLNDGRYVAGTFTTEDKAAFGGVSFESRKDIPALMKSKVLSVLAGTAE